MNEELDFEIYLSISLDKFYIYLFDKKNQKNLYKQGLKFENNSNKIKLDLLEKFLEDNVFKIEKLNGIFIKNILLIIESNEILNVDIGIKRKNYGENIDKKHMENILTEAQDIFKKNYQQKIIMHFIINKYLVNGEYYYSLDDAIDSDQINIEVKFISISKDFVHELDMILKKYHIKIIKYLDSKYIKNFFKDSDIDFSEMIYKIRIGQNQNEIKVIPKNQEIKGFFERFFQLFS